MLLHGQSKTRALEVTGCLEFLSARYVAQSLRADRKAGYIFATAKIAAKPLLQTTAGAYVRVDLWEYLLTENTWRKLRCNIRAVLALNPKAVLRALTVLSGDRGDEFARASVWASAAQSSQFRNAPIEGG